MSETSDGQEPKYGKFTCNYCGYVYDEEAGDQENGIAPGTRWEDLPEDWCCPQCSAEKDGFEPA